MTKSPALIRLQKRLDAIPEGVREAVLPALTKSGDEIAGRMRALIPVDEGDAQNSIAVTTPGNMTPPYSQPGGSAVVPPLTVRITVGDEDVRYPHLIEHGAEHAPAQPFFWPAFRLTRKRAENRIKRAISKAVREGWKQ